MKKGLVGAIVVVLLGYLGSSLFFAGKAEEQFKHSVRVFDQVLQDKVPTGPQLNLLVKDYSRGLLSSSAKLRIKLDLAGMPMRLPRSMSKMSYDLDLKINHGPFILPLSQTGMAYVESTAKLPEHLITKAKRQLSKDSSFPQLDLSLLINFDESSLFTSRIPAFTMSPKQFPGKLVWNGMDLVYSLSKDMSNVRGSAVLNGLDFSSPFAKGSVSKIEITSDMKASDFGLWVGTGAFNIPSITVSARGQNIFDLSKLTLDSSADIHNGLLDVGMNMALERFVSMAQSFGPGKVELSLKNLDAKALASTQGLLHQLKDAKRLPKEKINNLTKKLDLLFPKVVSRGAELSLNNAYFKMPQGMLKASLNVKVPAGIKAINSMDLVNHVVARGEFSVPKGLVKKQLFRQAFRKLRSEQRALYMREKKEQTQAVSLEQAETVLSNIKPVKRLSRREVRQLAKEKVAHQLKKLVDSQLLIKTDKEYVVKFSFDKGHLFINGQVFSPDMLDQ